MDRSTSVEQSLTPGEQRILTLMEQGQQRLEQRMQSLEQRLEQRMQSLEEGQKSTGHQLKELTLQVDQEAADSRMRDRQLTIELQRLREQNQERDVKLRETLYAETNSLRVGLSERLDQHNLRLEIVGQTLEKNCETHREHSKAIKGLQEDVRKLTTVVEGLAAQSPRMTATS